MKTFYKKLLGVLAVTLLCVSVAFPVRAVVDDSYTKSLLHFDGADASTTFTDESGKTVTPNGNAQLDTAQKVFGTASSLLDGNGDYLTWSDSTDFSPGTGAFTIDFRIRINSLGAYNTVLDMRTADNATVNDLAFGVQWGASGKPYVYGLGNGAGATEIATAFSTNTWYHVALVGNGGADGSRTVKCYINGVLADGVTVTVNYNLNLNRLVLGTYALKNNYFFNGWIEEFRFSKGIQRWTSDFTPPSAQYEPITTYIKTIDGLTKASVKTVNGLSISSVKTWLGLQ